MDLRGICLVNMRHFVDLPWAICALRYHLGAIQLFFHRLLMAFRCLARRRLLRLHANQLPVGRSNYQHAHLRDSRLDLVENLSEELVLERQPGPRHHLQSRSSLRMERAGLRKHLHGFLVLLLHFLVLARKEELEALMDCVQKILELLAGQVSRGLIQQQRLEQHADHHGDRDLRNGLILVVHGVGERPSRAGTHQRISAETAQRAANEAPGVRCIVHVGEREEVEPHEDALRNCPHPRLARETEDHRQDQYWDHVAQDKTNESVDVPFEGGAVGGGEDQCESAWHQGRVWDEEAVAGGKEGDQEGGEHRQEVHDRKLEVILVHQKVQGEHVAKGVGHGLPEEAALAGCLRLCCRGKALSKLGDGAAVGTEAIDEGVLVGQIL
mmetsp:Transcript_31245/g.58672  ORF Transcript_31245/g.58672 Transcript_31245/m.58672 type:complete len:383 (-) Transcript_31245:1501-2649(-)